LVKDDLQIDADEVAERWGSTLSLTGGV
jgi:hypothetical protein